MEEDKKIQKQLVAEFAKLPETVIFFLKKVDELRIVWDNVDDENKKREKIIRKKGKLEDRKVSIMTETDRCKEKHSIE